MCYFIRNRLTLSCVLNGGQPAIKDTPTSKKDDKASKKKDKKGDKEKKGEDCIVS